VAETLDLPLKALAWEDEQGLTWIAYNDPQYLLQRYGLPSHLSGPLAAALALIEAAAGTG
jgi:uncharacterized protein (DUF302 family)